MQLKEIKTMENILSGYLSRNRNLKQNGQKKGWVTLPLSSC
jgi:hypothetical protein